MQKPTKPKKPKKPLKSELPPSKKEKHSMFVFERYDKQGYNFLPGKNDECVIKWVDQNISEEEIKMYGWRMDEDEDYLSATAWDYFHNHSEGLGDRAITVDLLEGIAKSLGVSSRSISVKFCYQYSDYAELAVDWVTEKPNSVYQIELDNYNSRFDRYEAAVKRWEEDMRVYEDAKTKYQLWQLEEKKQKLLAKG